jgi:hypothetical protein
MSVGSDPKDPFADLQKAFEAEPRPEHFTNYRHCDECYEHDELLRSRDQASLRLEDVNNAAWDPICFVTDQGWRYYLPSLVRLAWESTSSHDWYLPQLLFHLISDGKGNRRVASCNAAQRKAIVAFLWHVLETSGKQIAEYNIENDLQTAIEIWSENSD